MIFALEEKERTFYADLFDAVDMKTKRFLAAGVTALLMAFIFMPAVQAGPYYYGGGWGGGYRGYYRGYGGWYGTGIPNGLGWTLFGLGAGAAIAAPIIASSVYAAPPVYASPPGYYYPAPPQTVTVHHYPQSEQAPPNGTLAKAQSKLAGLGYYKGTVDGNYGPQTAQAVQQFQADNNLPVSGRLDLKTLSSLGISL